MIRMRPFFFTTLLLAPALSAQETGKRIYIEPFNYSSVTAQVDELFGGKYDLGAGLARLLADKLTEKGFVIVPSDANADGRVSGSVIVFGQAQGRAELGGVSVRGVRVGLGRRQEKAAAIFEAQLVDKASGQTVEMYNGNGEGSRGGMDLAARFKGEDLAKLDLSGKQFRETAIGEATHKSIDQLVQGIVGGARQLGTLSAPAPAPVPVAAAAPAMAVAPVAVGGPFAWTPYMFRGSEHFRYDVRQKSGGSVETGYYQMDLEPAGTGRVRIKVQGRVGTDQYSSTVTTGVGEQGMQMGMGQFMALGPVGIMLFSPATWFMFGGRELTVGDEWSQSSNGESFSVKVEQSCSFAGQGGLSVVTRTNGKVAQESCLARDVALPLKVLNADEDGDGLEMTLTEYRP